MVKVKLIPTYRFVNSRCSLRRNPVDLAFGKAIDTALAQYNYYQSWTRRSLLMEAMKCAMKVFTEELRKQGVELSDDERRMYAGKAWRMLSCWRKSKYTRLLRPRTRVVLLERNGMVYGVFAQPDFWDRDRVFYEVKSYNVEKDEDAGRCAKEQCRVFALLGELRLIYFTEDANGYYTLVERRVERDLGVLNELWEYILKLSDDECTYRELKELEDYHPIVKYRFNTDTGKWEYLGTWSLRPGRTL